MNYDGIDTVETVEQIKDVLDHINDKAADNDDEAAHSCQDALWERVLTLIAQGASNPKELAATALRVGDIEFCRWCA